MAPRRLIFTILATLITLVIIGVPLVIAAVPALLHPTPLVILGCLSLAPFIYSLAFVGLAGLISVPFQSAIVPGRFPRDLGHPDYARRRLYGLCWTLVYYFKPVYATCLALPAVKTGLFRLFGYRGSSHFTVYPDTWIRDLPLLKFGKGAYVANRATLGTNIALNDGTILVDTITLGDGAMVGHLSMLAPGVRLGTRAEVGVGCAIGIRCELGDNTLVQPTCTLNHHARIADGVVVGTMSYLGAGSRVSAGVAIPPGTLLRNRSHVRSAEALAGSISSETDARQLLTDAAAS